MKDTHLLILKEIPPKELEKTHLSRSFLKANNLRFLISLRDIKLWFKNSPLKFKETHNHNNKKPLRQQKLKSCQEI